MFVSPKEFDKNLKRVKEFEARMEVNLMTAAERKNAFEKWLENQVHKEVTRIIYMRSIYALYLDENQQLETIDPKEAKKHGMDFKDAKLNGKIMDHVEWQQKFPTPFDLPIEESCYLITNASIIPNFFENDSLKKLNDSVDGSIIAALQHRRTTCLKFR